MTDSAAESQPAKPKVYPYVQVAAALLRRDGGIVLVHEQRGDTVFWSVPGGGVETGELVGEAVIREIKEEAGVTMRSAGRLAYIVNSTNGKFPSSVAFFFECEDWEGDIAPADPDQDVLHAALFSTENALTLLAESQATRPEIEPLVAYLRDPNAPARIWEYRDDEPVSAPDGPLA